MSVRSFHSVFMASAVAGAALGCYLISLRVASERAALEEVETQIVLAQRDIRLLQTEIGTRGRLAQLERWNVRVLALSAPTADQILGDKFQLAKLVRPEERTIDAPVVLASAPAPQPVQALGNPDEQPVQASAAQMLHEASLKLPEPRAEQPKTKPHQQRSEAKGEPEATATKAASAPVARASQKAGDKKEKSATAALTKPVRTAKVDPLAPLPTERSKSKGSRTER